MPTPLAFLPLSLALPLAAVALLRLRALRGPVVDPARAWFQFAFGSSFLTLAGVIGWLSMLLPTEVGRVGGSLWEWHAWLGPAACALLLAAPPLALSLAIAALQHDVSSRLRGGGWSRAETLSHGAWRAAGIALPLAAALAAAGAAGHGQARAAALLALGAVALRIVCERRRHAALDLAPHAVTHGDLRDRVFALAAAAGVKLRMLYVLPTARGRVANALAIQGGVVMCTDLLLQRLSRREVDAIVAHELAHLRRNHPRWLVLPATAILVLAFALAGHPSALSMIPLFSLAAVLATVTVSRRLEYSADRGAVELTRDPEALVSALAALARLNDLPLDWGPVWGAFLTHPSMVSRARAIGRAAGLDPARVAALLRDGLGESARHDAPDAAGGKVFSTRYKAEQGARLGLTVAGAWVTGAALALLALGTAAPRVLALAVAAAAAWLAGVLAQDLLAARPYQRLRRVLAARLAMEGLDTADAHWVGLTPTDRTRLYEGFSDWDVGFLWVRGDRLCFVGEETRFAVRREEVTALRLGAALPGPLAAPRVVIDRRAGAFTLRLASAPRMSAARATSRRLLALVREWLEGRAGGAAPAPHPVLDALPPLEAREVTALTPREVAHPRTLASAAVVLLVLAAIAGALLGLPTGFGFRPGAFDAWLATLVAAVVERLPWWRWRERPAGASANASAADAGDQRRAA